MSQNGLHLGMRPETLRVELPTGSDFYNILDHEFGASPWPAGTVLSIEFPSTTWTATISGTEATFDVDSTIADTIPDDTPAKLIYVNGGRRQVWAIGTAVRIDG